MMKSTSWAVLSGSVEKYNPIHAGGAWILYPLLGGVGPLPHKAATLGPSGLSGFSTVHCCHTWVIRPTGFLHQTVLPYLGHPAWVLLSPHDSILSGPSPLGGASPLSSRHTHVILFGWAVR